MGESNKLLERRGHSRFEVKGHAFTSNSMTQFGQIQDLSMTGFRFVFVDNGKWPVQSGQLDIDFLEWGGGIENVPCHTVWEAVLADKITGLTIKERGVVFDTLSDEQVEKLEAFLMSCSGGECLPASI